MDKKIIVVVLILGVLCGLMPGQAGATSWQSYHPEDFAYPYASSDFDGMYYDADSVAACDPQDGTAACAYVLGKEVEPDYERIYIMRIEMTGCYAATLCYKKGGEWHFPRRQWQYVGMSTQFPMLEVMERRVLCVMEEQRTNNKLRLLSHPLTPDDIILPANVLD